MTVQYETPYINAYMPVSIHSTYKTEEDFTKNIDRKDIKLLKDTDMTPIMEMQT
jgi:hypothetical protein